VPREKEQRLERHQSPVALCQRIRKRSQQINLGEKFDEIARPNGLAFMKY
jgi:hypothetical protein